MEDTIYRQDAVAALRHVFNVVNEDTCDVIDMRDLMCIKLRELPSAIRKGEWQRITVKLNDGEKFKALDEIAGIKDRIVDVHYDRCSECGYTRRANYEVYWFCPKCGAYMADEKESLKVSE